MDLTHDVTPPASALARYAIGGVAPRIAYVPETSADAEAAVREAAAQQQSLVPWGGGIGLSRDVAPPRYDAVLDLSRLRRIVTFEPDDFTIRAEVGITVQDLRATLAEHREELPLEAAEAWGSTLGGLLSANASGPRRLMFGGARDRLIGARFVTGAGGSVQTGGRVVKNVAGYGTHRLLCGAQGALAVLLEASLKLLPQPLARTALVQGCDEAMLKDPARWVDFPRREPAVLTVLGRALAAPNPVLACDAAFTVVTGFEEAPAWVDACAAFTRESLGAPRLKLQGTSALQLWQVLCDAEEMPGPRLTFTSAHKTPAALAPLAGRAIAERLLFHAPAGRLHVWPAAAEAAALASELAGHGFVLREARGVEVALPEAPTAVRALRSRIRLALDPGGVFAYDARWEAGR